MRIFTASQIQEWDKYTIDNEPISSINLMERASKAFVNAFVDEVSTDKTIAVFAGPGNNGGDGLAIARLLTEQGYSVTVYVAAFTTNFSNDFLENEKRLKKYLTLHYIKEVDDLQELKQDVIIEAIFGTGINREVEGVPAAIIKHINEADKMVYAVDVPSGMSCDKSLTKGAVIKAGKTFTFQIPKLTFFFPENEHVIGDWKVLDIGLHPTYKEITASNYHYTSAEWIKSTLMSRKKFAHKGSFGHALLMAGSFGKMGAAILASKACLRTGVGLLTTYLPSCGYQIMQQAIPEVMTLVDVQQDFITGVPKLSEYNAIGIGPGIGSERNTMRALEKLLSEENLPSLVIDADGLNILAQKKELLGRLPEKTVLTPHPGEFRRLVGEWVNDKDRLERQKTLAIDYNLIVVLKGANSSIALPNGEIYFNCTGNPGMATAGSGDVLTGIILSLLAQNYEPEKAAILGVYLHGYAGDEATKKLSQPSMIASDLIAHISDFYLAFA